jgi:hypothetical protein
LQVSKSPTEYPHAHSGTGRVKVEWSGFSDKPEKRAVRAKGVAVSPQHCIDARLAG